MSKTLLKTRSFKKKLATTSKDFPVCGRDQYNVGRNCVSGRKEPIMENVPVCGQFDVV